MPHDRICTSDVFVVRVNGNMCRVGSPTVRSSDVVRCCARARGVEPCKGCVAACFGACQFACVRLMVQVDDMTCRTIVFVLLMCLLYG